MSAFKKQFSQLLISKLELVQLNLSYLSVQEIGLLLAIYCDDDIDPECVPVQTIYKICVSAGTKSEVRGIIRGFFITKFDLDVDFSGDVLKPQRSYAQIGVPGLHYVNQKFWSVLSRGFSACDKIKNVSIDWLWSMAQKAFEACLGGYYEVISKAASWISSVWGRLKQWCTDLMSGPTKWLSGFHDCLVIGMGIVGVSAVLILIERFMFGSGLISSPLGLAQTFVLCYVGYVGLRDGGTLLRTSTSQMVANLIEACKKVVSCVSTAMDSDGVNVGTDESRAQHTPIVLLETFASTLTTFSTESLVQTGRVFNAFSQIKSGTVAIWSCVEKICSYLWELLDKGFGIKSRALADLSVMLGQDVQGWLKRCDAACEHMCLFPSLPQDVLRELKTLKCKGQDIRANLISRTERGSVAALSSVNKALEKLTTLLNAAILAGSANARNEPFWLAFVGKAGVGKSTAVNVMVSRYLADHDLEATDYYPRNTMDPFWSGYRRQTVVTYDDLGALSNGTTVNEEAELIKLVSRDALPLNMASVEEKGMYFDSSLIVTSSNFVNYSPHAQIHDDTSYQRRRKLLVEVVEKEGAVKDPSNPLAHQRYLVREEFSPFQVLSTLDTFEDLYAFFLDRNQSHLASQREITKSMKIPEKTLDSKVCALTQLMTLLNPFVPLSVQCLLKDYHQGYEFLAYHGEILYLWNSDLELKIVKDFGDEVSKEDLEKMRVDALTLALRFKNVLSSLPSLDPLTAHFLVELVEKQCFTRELLVRKSLSREDDQLCEVAEKMPKWQRAFVFVLSSHLNENGKGFFSSAFDVMCDKLQRVYTMDVYQWPMAVKMGFGMLLLILFGQVVFKTLIYLGNFGSGAAFAVAATRTFSQGQSDDEVRKRTSEYRHRNNPIQVRHWSIGQNAGISYEWLMKHSLAMFRYAHMDCQVMMLPGKRMVGVNHFFQRIPDGVIVEISLDEQKYHICWHKKCLQTLKDSELSVYEHPTLREVSSTLNDRCVFGIEHLPKTFPAVLASCKINDMTGEYESEIAHVVVNKRDAALNVYNDTYQRLVPTSLEYKALTVNKDCGSLLIANINGVDKIVGLHVSAVGGYGQSCFLPLQLERAMPQNWFSDHYNHFPYEEQVSNGTSVVGILKQEKQFFTQQKSSYIHTPEEWHLGTNCAKEPAILKKGDERLVGTSLSDYDPYRKGMEKYADEAGPFVMKDLAAVCEDILDEWHDAQDGFSFEEATLEEAINGIAGVDYMEALVLNTSEGYPYLLTRNHNKGKTRYMIEQDGKLMPNEELMANINKVEDAAANGTLVLVGVECAKDEKLPLVKIYEKPKTRLFTVLPMDFNIVVRKKFFPFVRFLMKRRDVLSCQVGVNPYGREWSRIANALLEKGNTILCCDYSRFDGLIPKPVMLEISMMINKLMGGSQRLQTQRTNLLLACCGRYGLCAGKVWRVENGIPSGFPLTVILNSIFNEIIIRYIYRRSWKDQLMQASFSRYVKIVTYGDDNLISVQGAIHAGFNGKVIQEAARDLKIGITDGVDKSLPNLSFRPIEKCDFLKRKFVKDIHGLWRAPMELESLWSQLHWVKTKYLDINSAYLVNLESVLRELFLHSPQAAQNLRYKALKVGWIEPQFLPTLQQLEAFHNMQIHDNKEFVCYAYDALITPSALGPIGDVTDDAIPFEFAGLVATKSGVYKREENDFVVCLRVASKYGEDGMFVDWPLVSGRGELPVASWLRTHLCNSKSELHKCLVGKRKAGKRIVFLGRNSNIASTVFLVLFGFSIHAIGSENSNQILAKAISVTKSLGYLVDAFPEVFFSKNAKHNSYNGKKLYQVYGATNYEVSLMRRSFSVGAFEHNGMSVPKFGEVKELIDFMLLHCKSGVVLQTFMSVEGFGGLPDVQWKTWLKQPRSANFNCVFGAKMFVFDANNCDCFEHKCEGLLVPGNKLEECFLVQGVPFGKLSAGELDVMHPVCVVVNLFTKTIVLQGV